MAWAFWAVLVAAEPIKVGIVGLDTSHAGAFAALLEDPKAVGPGTPFRVVAAYAGGSADIPESRDRVAGYARELHAKHNAAILDSVARVVEASDAILLETNDGRPHLAQFRYAAGSGKPVFVDKPVAADLADACAIYALAERTRTPIFSSSALRYAPGIAAARANSKLGGVLGAVAYSPCHREPHHADLYWYGVHGVETLFTVMGPGCKTVARTAADGADVATGVWEDGRIGVFRGGRAGAGGFGALVFGQKTVAEAGPFTGYQPLVAQIATFFRTKVAPLSASETLEIYAFMSAADESKSKGGVPVAVAAVLAKAQEDAVRRLADAPPGR